MTSRKSFKLPVTQVTNYLAFARREFRRLALERLASLCGSEEIPVGGPRSVRDRSAMTRISDAALEHLRDVAEWPGAGRQPLRDRRRAGAGGMGTVFLARDRELEREVALKVLRAAASTPDTALRLRREARILAQLEHPGIVPVH